MLCVCLRVVCAWCVYCVFVCCLCRIFVFFGVVCVWKSGVGSWGDIGHVCGFLRVCGFCGFLSYFCSFCRFDTMISQERQWIHWIPWYCTTKVLFCFGTSHLRSMNFVDNMILHYYLKNIVFCFGIWHFLIIQCGAQCIFLFCLCTGAYWDCGPCCLGPHFKYYT